MRILPEVPVFRRLAAGAALALALAACGSSATAPAGDNNNDGDGSQTTMMAQDTAANGVTDAEVFAIARGDTTWMYYKFSLDTLDADPTSPHQGRIRTRYNTFAATQLDSAGKVMSSADFPDRSVIAKEVYSDEGGFVALAVMIKIVGDPHAGHGEWLWGEYKPDGTPTHSILEDNGSCHNCHVGGIDHTRMNDAHP